MKRYILITILMFILLKGINMKFSKNTEALINYFVEYHIYQLNNDEAFAMIYTFYIAFWLSVNLRICSILNLKSDTGGLKESCDLHFNFIKSFILPDFLQTSQHFYERKRICPSSILCYRNVVGEEVVNQLLNLSLNFIMDADSLKSNEFDKYNQKYTAWNMIDKTELNEKLQSSVFLFDIAEKNETTKRPYFELYSQVIKRIDGNILRKIHNYFSRKITDKDYITDPLLQENLWYPNYNESVEMWKKMKDEEWKLTSSTKAVNKKMYAVELIQRFREKRTFYTIKHLQLVSYS